jgi:hypothetical protein
LYPAHAVETKGVKSGTSITSALAIVAALYSLPLLITHFSIYLKLVCKFTGCFLFPKSKIAIIMNLFIAKNVEDVKHIFCMFIGFSTNSLL